MRIYLLLIGLLACMHLQAQELIYLASGRCYIHDIRQADLVDWPASDSARIMLLEGMRPVRHINLVAPDLTLTRVEKPGLSWELIGPGSDPYIPFTPGLWTFEIHYDVNYSRPGDRMFHLIDIYAR